ncbi:MAG: hypothetical protein GY717_05680 [Rhodobacteraceae bacterium]|nr:hypothetical protein [Paracoccaceae bacterium]
MDPADRAGDKRHAVTGPFESDDGDVLTAWALAGRGIVMKPVFEVAARLATGDLVAGATPPTPTKLTCLSPVPHRKRPEVAAVFGVHVGPDR